MAPRVSALIVDVANVVGSRPDGWWRDRTGATERLLAQIAAWSGEAGVTVTAVVEGRVARELADVAGVEVVRAVGSGDDEVARQSAARPGAVVITADRGLRARLPAAADTVGPGWLRERLDRHCHRAAAMDAGADQQ